MCAIVFYKDIEISTIGELRKLMPVLIGDNLYNVTVVGEDDICLCPINIEATAKANGFVAQMDDAGDYTVAKLESP